MSTAQRTALILFLAAALAGCVDTTAVVTFSQISAQTASYTAVVNDYVDSAAREVRYAPDNAILQKMEQEAKDNQKGLLAIQQAIVDYMSALGKLAGDQQSGVTSASGTLVDSMVSTKLISSSDKDAATALANLIAGLATQGYQEKELHAIIEKSNAPFQKLMGTLKEFVGTEYPARINAEGARLKQTLYEDIAYNNQLGTDQRPAKSIASILYAERVVDLEARKTNAKAYLPVLDKISAGHQTLYDNRDKLDAKDLIAQMKGYSSDIKTLYNKLKP